MKLHTERVRKFSGIALALVLVLLPVVAFAVETDRLTVEDPSNGTVKFKVTSSGNVSGAVFTGDGSGLTNVPHWKGTWSGVTTYAKDDTVYYNGGSYIALQVSTNLAPNANPTYWAVMASQGPAGATGAQGPAGSSDTQAQIMSKLATSTDGAVVQLQQGPTELKTAAKLNITDKNGITRFSASPQMLKVGDANDSTPVLELSGSVTGADIMTLKRTVGANLQFGLSLAGGGLTFSNRTAGTSNLFLTTFSGVPAMVVGLDNYSGAGKDAVIRPGGANVNSTTNAAGSSLILTSSPQTGSGTRGEIVFKTYPVSGTANQWSTPLTRVKVQRDGALEVMNGVKFTPSASKPACDGTTRGTFWFTQQDPDDIVEVCAMVSGALAWKALW
ncbi:MAG TPA: hypothetical protein VN642_19805 [Dongiaceae bacterium]|nr:hypothetical protein [Dongiaceae bacterium]